MPDYDQPANDSVDFTLESYNQPANDSVDFSLVEPEPGEPAGPFLADPDSPVQLPFELDLPVGPLNVRTMNTGLAVFVVGLLVFLGGASAILRNVAAMSVLGLSVVALLMSGTLGVSLGYFWAAIIGCVLILIAGAIGRVLVS